MRIPPLSIYSAVRWSLVAAIARAFVQAALVAILARLMDSREFGVMAIATPYVLLAGILSDPGVTSSLLYVHSVAPRTRDSLFWIGTGWSTFIALCLCGAAPALASCYHEPELTWLILASAPSLPLQFIARQVEINRERSLQLRGVVLSETLGVLMGAAVAIVIAHSGFGSLSFAALVTVPAAVRAITNWAILADGWRPKFCLAFRDALPSLRYGVPLTVAVGATTLSSSSDLLIGGFVLSVEELGCYGLVRQFALFVSQFMSLVVNRIAVPLFSQLRNQQDLASDTDQTARTLIATFVTILFGGIAASPVFFSRHVLGITYSDAGVTLSILMIWAWSRTLAGYDHSLLTALGRVRVLAVWQISFAAIAAFLLYAGAGFGALGLAWSSALTGLVSVAALWYFQVRGHFGMTTAAYLHAISRSIAGVGFAFVLATVICDTSTTLGSFWHFGIVMVGSLAAATVADRTALRQVMALIRSNQVRSRIN